MEPQACVSDLQGAGAEFVDQASQAAGHGCVPFLLLRPLQKGRITLQPMAARVKTLTFDNGKEFAGHAYIDQQLQSTAYFARPFASWERGSNENLNGLLRQYVPKKRAMSTVSDEEIRMIQNRLNNRPRKRLGFKTPAEVFHQSLKRVALRT